MDLHNTYQFRATPRKNPPPIRRRGEEGVTHGSPQHRIINIDLINIDHAKNPVEVVLWSGRVEKLVVVALTLRSAAKLDTPQLIDDNVRAPGILDGSYESAGRRIEAVDGAGIGVVADQKRTAKNAKVGRRHSNTPGLVERLAVNKSLHERSVLIEDIDVSTGFAIGPGKGNIYLAADVLDTKRRVASRQRSVGERIDQMEVPVINVDFVIPEVGGIQQIARRVAGDRQAGVDSARSGVIDADQRVVWVEVRPSADRAVEGGEKKGRCPGVNLEFRRSVVDDARRRTHAAAGRGRNRDHQTLLCARARVERREA